MTIDHRILQALAVAVYVTDAEGRLTCYNEPAAQLWGYRPELGAPQWYDSWRLFGADGRPMPYDQSPMAVMLHSGGAAASGEMVAERPDGSRLTFLPYPSLLEDDAGNVTGAINLLVEIAGRRDADIAAARLAAIVASSQDAIIGKTLDGVVTSWNQGAERIFGYRAGEMIGQSIRKIIPPEHQTEEDQILARLRRGERVEHFETVRVAKGGRRVDLSITVSPVKDSDGRLVGASKVGRDITGRKRAEAASARLAAIVSSSDDAIVSKDLNGVVTSWNHGAERIFGYKADEMIGRSIRQLVPDDLQQQEDDILSRIGRGERIEHFDTVRLTKGGKRIDVSLTISPLRDSAGRIIGASKIARDIRERKRNEELQRLLFDELNHRVKNTLAIIQAIAGQSLRRAASPGDFVISFNARVNALARAHDLLVHQQMRGASIGDLVRDQVILGVADEPRVTYSGPQVALEPRLAVEMALVLHELATNARKHGGLSTPTGRLRIAWEVDLHHGRELHLTWQESGVAGVRAPRSRGFGTTLIERSLKAHKGASSLHFGADGLTCEIRLRLPEEDPRTLRDSIAEAENGLWTRRESAGTHREQRILVVEDEPIVSMQLESDLMAHGFEVVGPAADLEEARQLIAKEKLDAALLDANLNGDPVDELAAALTEKSVPFAFATGYGREALPEGFRDAEVLAKPFQTNQVIAAVRCLLSREQKPDNVLALRPKNN